MVPSSGGSGSPPRQQHENRSGSNPIGENSRSTQQWKDVPRGTMDEVSSHVRLSLPFKLTARPRQRLFYFVLESHDGRAAGADSEEKREPVSDIDTVVADSLKVLDLKRPIREADIAGLPPRANKRHCAPLSGQHSASVVASLKGCPRPLGASAHAP